MESSKIRQASNFTLQRTTGSRRSPLAAERARYPGRRRMKGLIVRQPWIDKILSGAKIWELRGSATRTRGPIALIQGGTGTVVGTCQVVGVKGPLSLSQLRRTTSRHLVPSEVLRNGLVYRKTYAWILARARRLRSPMPYRHPSGAVIWVNLSPGVVKSIGRITPRFSGRASRAADRGR